MANSGEMAGTHNEFNNSTGAVITFNGTGEPLHVGAARTQAADRLAFDALIPRPTSLLETLNVF